MSSSESETTSETTVTNTDRKVASQDQGIAISVGDKGGDIFIDQVPENLLDLTANVAQGASELVADALDVVSLQTANAVAATAGQEVKNPVGDKSNNLLLGAAVLAVAYVAVKG